MGTSAHSELDYVSSSNGDLHSVKRRSDTTSQRQFVTKVGFARSDSTPAPKTGVPLLGEHSTDQTVDLGGLCYEVRNLLDLCHMGPCRKPVLAARWWRKCPSVQRRGPAHRRGAEDRSSPARPGYHRTWTVWRHGLLCNGVPRSYSQLHQPQEPGTRTPLFTASLWR